MSELCEAEILQCNAYCAALFHGHVDWLRITGDMLMIVADTEYVDLSTPDGPMRTHIVRPAGPGRYPGILVYSEFFQVTAPVHRMGVMLAGQGYVVAVPEIYHEFEPLGTVL